MNQVNKERKTQKEIFTDAYNLLKNYTFVITSLLVKDIYDLIVQTEMVLDDLYIRMVLFRISSVGEHESGNHLAVIRSRVKGVFCNKCYYIPINFLYPIDEGDTNVIRMFINVPKSNS